MNTTAVKLLKFKTKDPSRWRENALSRLDNQDERRKARKLAMKIINALEAIGMSTQAFAERLGVDYETLLPILQGHQLPTEELDQKISRVLPMV